MRFDWEDYLNLAGDLLVDESAAPVSEARLRTAGSRSYYGVYGLAVGYLGDRMERRETLEPRPGSHEFVIQELAGSGDRTERRLSAHLRRLRDIRVFADYRDSPSFRRADADTAQLVADRALSTLRELEACASDSAEAQ